MTRQACDVMMQGARTAAVGDGEIRLRIVVIWHLSDDSASQKCTYSERKDQ